MSERISKPEQSCMPDCMMPDGAEPCIGYQALQQEVERLREELAGRPANGFHHPDCNWWKWDWRHSWDDTDCNCDKVAGPAIAEAREDGDAN